MKRTKETVEKSFSGTDKKLVFDVFNKECSKKEINRLVDVCKANGIDCVVGIAEESFSIRQKPPHIIRKSRLS
jgi:glycerol dehydrogenase